MIPGRDTSKDRITERGRINGRIGKLSFAKSMVHTAAHNSFPEVDFNLPLRNNAAVTETASTAAPGASAVSHAMTAAQEQLRSQAHLNVARAIAEPGPVTTTTVPSRNEGAAGITGTMTPEQAQHITYAQQLVEGAFNESAA